MEIKSNNPIKILAICVFAFFVVGFLFFYFYEHANAPEKRDKIFCTQEAKQCPDGSHVSRIGSNCEFAKCPMNGGEKLDVRSEIDTSTWKTYRNEKYGFEVKHPVDWIIRKNTGEYWDISWDGKLNSIPYILDLGYISQDTLNTMGITYCGANSKDTRCENYKWNGLNAIIDWNIETEGAFTQSMAEIQHPNGGLIVISIYHRPTQDIKTFFHQILSTFKFLK